MYGRIVFQLSAAAMLASTVSPILSQPAKKAISSKTLVAVGQSQNNSLTSLTAEEVQMIILSEAKNNPLALKTLAESADQRKVVLENLKQALAVASEARKTGFASENSMKVQLDLARKEVLATAYDDKLKADAGKAAEPSPPFAYIEDSSVAAFFASPANTLKYAGAQKKFLAFITAMQAKSTPPAEMNAEQEQFIVSQWKKVEYGATKAEALKLSDLNIELQWKLQQALLLARAYSQEKFANKLTPTGDEVKAYMAANPRFSKTTQRAKADEILAKVKAGADFAALANEYSEDPGNTDPKTGKGQGGLYDWRNRDGYVAEFSNASWALEAGQVSPVVETQFGYHIIKLEGKRVEKDSSGASEEQVKVRHILISTEYKEEEKESDSKATAKLVKPFMSMEDGARQELTEKKELQVISDILLRNPIALPDDFSVSAETAAPASGPKTPVKAKSAAGAKSRPAAPRTTKKRS